MDKQLRYLSALRYFEAAARLKSYSAAAKELNVTQAAVSQQLRGLEDNLGCKLFFRNGREMQLTDKGHQLLAPITEGFEKIIVGLNRIQTEPLEGVLTVTVPPSFASLWLMPRLWRFTLENPTITIRIHSDIKRVAILHSDIDLAIRQGKITENDTVGSIRCEHLYQEEVYPLCSAELARSIQFDSPEKLKRCWLIHGVNSKEIVWSKWFEKAGVKFDNSALRWMEVPTFDMALNAVIAGHGVCLGTESLSKALIDQGLLVKPFDIGLTPGMQFSLLYDGASSRLPRIEAFRNWLFRELEQSQYR